jgi:ubiquinone/menaquinone biosynthesis C-methylase UbiE
MASRAIQAELLQQRISENRAAQEIDLGTWIFEHMKVRPDDQVLELCCGTGAQSVKFLDLLRRGSLTALDISQDALDALATRVASARDRVHLLCGDLDQLAQTLESTGRRAPAYDLVFCAYGLYYSVNSVLVLQELKRWLLPGGRVVIVGPYGPNNSQLFDLVRASGVTIPAPVIDSSERFMLQTVLPWSTRHFESVAVHTMVNRVRWATAERVMNYWQNTTFYEPDARLKFNSLLKEHFLQHREFVNEKWVMMLEMKNARA